MYPEGSLTGKGKILSTFVRCIEPQHLVNFHTGYKLKETDFHDVKLLCERFNLVYPDEYKHLKDT